MYKRLAMSILTAIASGAAVLLLPATAFAALPAPPKGAIVVSNHSGTDKVDGCATTTNNSIQTAVNNAPAGSTIYVCEGTYNESVQINQPLVLDGAQFKADAGSRKGPETVIDGAGGITYGSGATTGTLSGFTLNGYTGAVGEIQAVNVGSGWTFANDIIDVSNGGIYFNTAGQANPPATMIAHDLFMQSVPAAENGGGDFGQAVLIWQQAANNVTVTQNDFVNLSGPGAAINTTAGGNCQDPSTDPGDFSNNLKIDRNSFVDNGNPGFPGGGTDENFLAMFCTTSAEVSHNTVTNTLANDPNAESPIYLGGGDWGTTADHNQLVGNGADGAAGVSFNSDFYAPGTGVEITHNNISGFLYGINVRSGGSNAPPSGFTVDHNQVTNSLDIGIRNVDGFNGTFSHNQVSRSANDDCFDATTGGSGTSGTYNTWSKNHGATSSPPGLCEK